MLTGWQTRSQPCEWDVLARMSCANCGFSECAAPLHRSTAVVWLLRVLSIVLNYFPPNQVSPLCFFVYQILVRASDCCFLLLFCIKMKLHAMLRRSYQSGSWSSVWIFQWLHYWRCPWSHNLLPSAFISVFDACFHFSSVVSDLCISFNIKILE